MPINSDAAAMLRALATPERLTLLATVARRAAAGEDCSLDAVAAALGMPVRGLVKEATRLAEGGVLTISGRTLGARLSVLTATAHALVDELPIAGLLRTAPDLSRYFVNGRLAELPGDPAVLSRLAPMLGRLLPGDRTMTEREVNDVLRQVHDDHAALRRLLVDYGQLTRAGAADYRRAG
jgi:hypothetical protein